MLPLRATMVVAIVATLARAQTPTPKPTPTPTPAQTPTSTPTSSPTAPPPKHLEVEWQKNLAPAGENDAPEWLVLGDAHVFVPGADGTVEARSATDGHLVWSWSDRCLVAPAVAGGNLAIVTSDSLIAVDQTSGQARWRVPIEGTGAPVLLVGAADRIAVFAEGGVQTWDASGKAGWRTAFSGVPITNVAVAGGVLVFGTDQPAIVGLDSASGTLKWTIPLTTKPRPIAATAERVYFGGEDGKLYSYRIDENPKEEWRPFRRPLSIGTPLVDARAVYFTLLDNTISAFTAGGGTQVWGHELETRPATGPMRLGETFGIPLTNGSVAEVNVKTGKPVSPASATAGPPVRILSAALSADGARIYTLTIATDKSRTLVVWAHSKPAEGKH